MSPEQRARYSTRRNRRTTGAEAMHELVAIARQEAVDGRGAYIPAVLHDGITHADLQRLAVDALVACGYRVFYQPDSRMSPSGWLDIFAVNPYAPIYQAWAIEVKVGADRLRPAQESWWDDLTEIDGVVTFELCPEYWESFLRAIDDGHVARGRALLKGEA